MRKSIIFCTCSALFLASQLSVVDAAAKSKKFIIEEKAASSTTTSALGKGTVTTPSGLQYKDLKVGEGPCPVWGQAVSVHYTRWLYPSGRKVNSSRDSKVPYQFVVGVKQVAPGWDEAMMSMKKGGKRLLLIPPQLAYGDRGIPGAIPPDSTIKMEIELLGMEPPRHRPGRQMPGKQAKKGAKKGAKKHK